MMLAARGAIRASGAGLPYDAELEYLESTGTQYIDTGVSIDTSTDVIRCTLLPFANTGTYETYFGVGEKIDGADKFFEVRKNNGITRIIGLFPYPLTIKVASNTSFNADGAWHNLTYSAEELVLDNYVNSLTPDPTTFSKTLYLFARHNLESDTPGIAASCRMSAFQHYRNGVLVRDFIPVRVGTVGYLYDRVTKRLFGNMGTGDFVLGPDVIPVEYIESHGTEWVDSGITEASSIQVEWMWMTGNDVKPFGANISGLRYSNFCIYNGKYRDTDITLSKEEWQTVTMDNVNGTLTVKQGNAEFTANSWFRVTTPSENGRIVPIFGVSHNDGTLYDGTRIYTSGGKRFRRCTTIYNGVVVKNDIPIRVGTGSTWEGAMIDTLTRRIYRNQGTGSFSYGNDLRYPIPA